MIVFFVVFFVPMLVFLAFTALMTRHLPHRDQSYKSSNKNKIFCLHPHIWNMFPITLFYYIR
ncbi:uncharacterized protein B0P05DRAFT_539472, partial [Gilbertella persicaria]|uniref:uncharacterized protein n=1 Tax=Gilbertella persicaria TaxID=101096 RepID=UPI00221F14E1